MAHWSSIFSISDFLPMLAFPFVKMFQNNHLVAFEVIASFVRKFLLILAVLILLSACYLIVPHIVVPLLGYSLILFISVSWCQGWYEYFPHPPVNVLTCVENLLNHYDNKLLQHLTQCDVSAKV